MLILVPCQQEINNATLLLLLVHQLYLRVKGHHCAIHSEHSTDYFPLLNLTV